jgi:GT2 family glycosyltransferase
LKVQVIIVDNASRNDPLVDLEGLPEVTVIRNSANHGFAKACNQGMTYARAEQLLFINPDCVLSANALSEMQLSLQQSTDIGMVGGVLLNADGTEQAGGRRAVPTPWRSFVRAFGFSRFASRWPKLFYDFHLHKQPLPAEDIEVEAISGACMLVKREAVNLVGIWDEDYFLHCEDLDWCMRFRQQGLKIVFVPTARVEHALGACSRTRPLFVEWHKHKGMLHFYRKFFRHQYPGFLMWFVTLGVWLRFGAVVAYYIARRLGSLLGVVRA